MARIRSIKPEFWADETAWDTAFKHLLDAFDAFEEGN